MITSLRIFIAVALLTAAGALYAGDPVVVDNAWIRYLPGDGPMAGYFTLHNQSDEILTLVGASSQRFAKVQLHRATDRDGMASMEQLDVVLVPPHGEVAFKPGGYHLMLMQRQGEFSVGDEVTIALHFGDKSVREVRFVVKSAWQE